MRGRVGLFMVKVLAVWFARIWHSRQLGSVHVANYDVPAPRIRTTGSLCQQDPSPDLEGLSPSRIKVGEFDSSMVPRHVLTVVLDVEEVERHASLPTTLVVCLR
jgi:hypothetical protein